MGGRLLEPGTQGPAAEAPLAREEVGSGEGEGPYTPEEACESVSQISQPVGRCLQAWWIGHGAWLAVE